MTRYLKNPRFLGIFALVFLLSASSLFGAQGTDPTHDKEETAKVIIYRPGSWFGMAVRIKVKVSDLETVKIKNRTRTELEIPAGEANFKVKFHRKADFSMDLEPGATYYIRGSILPGWLLGRPQLIEVSEGQGQRDLDRYKFRKKRNG